ncbi:hypothetical protein [Paenibacillus sp. MZ03-122A]|uniref:hypothetical protein n=1 Tax=Paenibacillus sp. MZ03-122A TaxID=2962033 RepID=UPI0020B89251|nr:hypothetical protein [Paenibacillus sp. MZ03-122A]MCP3780437.1 hypothetical protein [Paenibacillus sp. MZ03-122A]
MNLGSFTRTWEQCKLENLTIIMMLFRLFALLKSKVIQLIMCGVLIYTAAGDSDGTMGGLVRMWNKRFADNRFKITFCTEIGLQGPDSCNLAACHSCSLVPETACEEFNRFLDRGLVVPLHGVDPLTAFFN